MAAAGATWAATGTMDNPINTTDQPGQAVNPATETPSGQTTVDTKTATAIQARLAKTINSALTRDGFDAVVGDLAKPDRDRITAEHFTDLTTLNGNIDQFRKDWRDKYNQDFDIQSATLDGLPIYQGADKDHARVWLSSFQKGGSNNRTMDQPNTPSGLKDNPGAQGDTNGQGNANAQGKQDTITAKTGEYGNDNPASSDLNNKTMGDNAMGGNATNVTNAQALTIVNEGGLGNMWRLTTPGTLSARQLSDSLGTHIKILCDNKASWPSDVKEGYWKVSHHVLTAIANPTAPNTTVENR